MGNVSAVQYFRYNELVKYTNILKYSAASRSPRIMPVVPTASFRYAYRIGNSTIFRHYILKDLERTERRKGIFAMRTEFDRYLLIVDLLLEVEPRFDKSVSREIDATMVSSVKKIFF